jgi:hypothetical protein
MAPPNYEQLLQQIKLPGLNQVEHEVAMKWLRARGMNYDRIDFNVPLGPVPDFNFPMTEEQQRQAEYLYRTKADIVAQLGDDVTIVEVKERATKSAMGQLVHYRYWFLKENPSKKVVAVRVIANRADEGIAETLLAHGFDLELYGEP